MKEILKKLGTSLITGLGIGIGIISMIFVYDSFKEARDPFPLQIQVDAPEGFLITNARLVTLGQYLTIAAGVENSSGIKWGSAEIIAELFDKEGFFATCEAFSEFQPKEKKNIELRCNGIHSHKAPEEVKFEVRVVRANRK